MTGPLVTLNVQVYSQKSLFICQGFFMVKDTQNNVYYFIFFSKEKKFTQATAKDSSLMQKKTPARHVGISMVFFLTRCLVSFYDRKIRFTPIDFHCNLRKKKFDFSF